MGLSKKRLSSILIWKLREDLFITKAPHLRGIIPSNHMRKQLWAALLLPALFLLGGAGCNSLYQDQTPPASPETASTTAVTSPSVAIILTAEALNPGIVKFIWKPTANFDEITQGFFLLHSAKPEPAYPGAFFYRRAGTDREGVWGKIPSGTRYFRICETDGDKCLNYSNVVQLDVK